MGLASKTDRFVGIDVSNARVDVHVRPEGIAFYCATDMEGLATLAGRVTPVQPRLVVLEARGGYEGVVAAVRAEAGLPMAIVNSRRVRKFADGGDKARWRCLEFFIANMSNPHTRRAYSWACARFLA
jgi:transposase